MTFEDIPFSESELKNASPLALAFVGDAVHTLAVRTRAYGNNPYDNNALHRASSDFCRAEAQAEAVKKILPTLSPDEEFIFKKGKNAKVNSVPKNASLTDYKTATGLEALIGYLYLSQKEERLKEILDRVCADEGQTEV